MDRIAAQRGIALTRLGPRSRVLLRQGVWFAVVGVLATGLNSLLYLLLRQWTRI